MQAQKCTKCQQYGHNKSCKDLAIEKISSQKKSGRPRKKVEGDNESTQPSKSHTSIFEGLNGQLPSK